MDALALRAEERRTPGFGPHLRFSDSSRKVLGKPAGEGESPVSERKTDKAVSRVHRDT